MMETSDHFTSIRTMVRAAREKEQRALAQAMKVSYEKVKERRGRMSSIPS
jgi:hypothetical protein